MERGYSEYFSLEEPIQASGNEIGSQSPRIFKLTRNPKVASRTISGTVGKEFSGQRGFLTANNSSPSNRTQLNAAATVTPKEYGVFAHRTQGWRNSLKSGDLVEVELVDIDLEKRLLEYLDFRGHESRWIGAG